MVSLLCALAQGGTSIAVLAAESNHVLYSGAGLFLKKLDTLCDENSVIFSAGCALRAASPPRDAPGARRVCAAKRPDR